MYFACFVYGKTCIIYVNFIYKGQNEINYVKKQ